MTQLIDNLEDIQKYILDNEEFKKINKKQNGEVFTLYDYFSSKKHIDQNSKKVIMSCSGKLSPIYDDGKYVPHKIQCILLLITMQKENI